MCPARGAISVQGSAAIVLMLYIFDETRALRSAIAGTALLADGAERGFIDFLTSSTV